MEITFFKRTGSIHLGLATPLPATKENTRFAKALAWVARELWRKLTAGRYLGPVFIILHRGLVEPGILMRCSKREGVGIVYIDLLLLTEFATDETPDPNARIALFRGAKATAAEELHHLRSFYMDQLKDEPPYGKPKTNRTVAIELLKHYAVGEEYRALRFVVEATGERAELLKAVEIHREVCGII